MNFKEAGNGWYVKIFDDGTKTPSWDKKNKPGYYQEMMDWVAEGNEVEPQFTVEELAEKEDLEAEQALESTNREARQFLIDTDWKTIRHMDQLAAGIETSLTDEEYQSLLTDRQAKRDLIVEI